MEKKSTGTVTGSVWVMSFNWWKNKGVSGLELFGSTNSADVCFGFGFGFGLFVYLFVCFCGCPVLYFLQAINHCSTSLSWDGPFLCPRIAVHHNKRAQVAPWMLCASHPAAKPHFSGPIRWQVNKFPLFLFFFLYQKKKKTVGTWHLGVLWKGYRAGCWWHWVFRPAPGSRARLALQDALFTGSIAHQLALQRPLRVMRRVRKFLFTACCDWY